MEKKIATNTKSSTIITPNAAVSFWDRPYFSYWFVFVFASLLFINSIPNDYSLDDELVTIRHRLTSKGVAAIPEIFNSPYYQDEAGYSYEYRPVVLATFAIEHELFGDNPHVSHFINVLLYGLTCLILYLVLLKLFKDNPPLILLATSLLFIVHPAHTEVVCNIKNRDEILALLFGLLSFWAAMSAVIDRRIWAWILLAPLFMLGLMAKVTIISFMLIIPIGILFFTQGLLWQVLLSTILLSLPTYFLIQVPSGLERLGVILGLIGFVFLVWSALNYQIIILKLKRSISAVWGLILRTIFINKQAENLILENVSTTFWQSIIPSKELLKVFPIVLISSLVSGYYYLLAHLHPSIGIGVLAMLFTLIWLGKSELAWWAEVGLDACLIMSAIQYESELIKDYRQIISVYFIAKFVLGRRAYFLPSFLLFSVYTIFTISQVGSANGVVEILLFLSLMSPKFKRFALFYFPFTFVINLLDIFYLHENSFNLIAYSYTLLITLSAHFKRGFVALNSAALILTFGILIFINRETERKIHLPSISAKPAITSINKINPQIISKPSYRPLEFIEQSVPLKSPQSLRIGTSLEILLCYLQKVVLPYPLSYYYGYAYIKPMKINEAIPLLSLLLHILLLLMAFYFYRMQRALSFGIVLYLVSIAVFSNYFQSVAGMLADRFLLIPSLGWCIVMVFGLVKIFKINPKTINWKGLEPIPKYSFLTILVLYSCITFARNFQWKDYLTLFRHDIEYVSNSAQAHNLLAVRLMKTSIDVTDPNEHFALQREALGHFKRTLEIYPSFFNANYDIARTYASLNVLDTAIVYFDKTIALNDSFTDAYTAAGEIYMQQQKYDQALPYFQYIKKTFPNAYQGYDKVSFIYFMKKDIRAAINTNLEAIPKMPNDLQPLTTLGKIYQSINQRDSARLWFGIALAKAPNDQQIQGLYNGVK